MQIKWALKFNYIIAINQEKSNNFVDWIAGTATGVSAAIFLIDNTRHERHKVPLAQILDLGAQHPYLLLCVVVAGSDCIQVGAHLSHTADVH